MLVVVCLVAMKGRKYKIVFQLSIASYQAIWWFKSSNRWFKTTPFGVPEWHSR